MASAELRRSAPALPSDPSMVRGGAPPRLACKKKVRYGYYLGSAEQHKGKSRSAVLLLGTRQFKQVAALTGATNHPAMVNMCCFLP